MLNEKLRPYAPYIGILVVLGILLAYTQFRQKGYEVAIEPMFDFNASDVTAFTVSKENVSVTIVKADTLWSFAPPDTGKPESYRIDQFVKEVIGGQHEGAVTNDTSRYSKYGVRGETSTKLEIRKGDKVLAKIYLGQSASDYNTEFVRYEGDDHVYPVRGRIATRLGAVASWWR